MRGTGRTYRMTLRALVEASIKKQDVCIVVVGRNAMKSVHSDIYRLAPQGSEAGRYTVTLPNGSTIRIIQAHANLSGVRGIRFFDHNVMENIKQ